MKVYKDMINEVLHYGTRKENRTGVDTLSTFNFNYELCWDRRMYGRMAPPNVIGGNLNNIHFLYSKGLTGAQVPLLTTKKMSWKNIVVEMLWFLSGDTDISILKRHGCKFWDAWADEDGKVPSAYGNFWRKFPVHLAPDRKKPTVEDLEEILNGTGDHPNPRFNDQIAWALNTLRTNPMSRRVVVSAWAPGNAQTSKLPPCHFAMCFNVQLTPRGEQRLCLHLTQRSCDLALGVPYNMASYGLLLLIMSHLTGIKPGIFAHTLLDLHIYTKKPNGDKAKWDHLPGLKDQLGRQCRELPRLIIDESIKELSDIEALMLLDTDQVLDVFKLEGYDPAPAIKFKVAV